MTALAAGRNTPQRSGDTYSRGVAAGVTIYPGALVALTAAGFATPGAVATTLIADGRAQCSTPVVGGVANGDVTIEVRPGTYKYANSAAADLIATAEIGDDCYIVDDQTVAKTNGGATRSVAGKIMAVDADGGVWVRIGIR